MTTQKITLGNAIDQILEALNTLEKKEQQVVISTVCSFLEITLVGLTSPLQNTPLTSTRSHSEAASTHAANTTEKTEDHGHKHGLDIRTLKDQKQPSSARQMACLVAYYLLDHAPDVERKQAIVAADLEKYFKQAGFKLPAKLEQLLIDCKASGYFETIARGEYKLTRVGYNLVTHSMPKSNKS